MHRFFTAQGHLPMHLLLTAPGQLPMQAPSSTNAVPQETKGTEGMEEARAEHEAKAAFGLIVTVVCRLL